MDPSKDHDFLIIEIDKDWSQHRKLINKILINKINTRISFLKSMLMLEVQLLFRTIMIQNFKLLCQNIYNNKLMLYFRKDDQDN